MYNLFKQNFPMFSFDISDQYNNESLFKLSNNMKDIIITYHFDEEHLNDDINYLSKSFIGPYKYQACPKDRKNYIHELFNWCVYSCPIN